MDFLKNFKDKVNERLFASDEEYDDDEVNEEDYDEDQNDEPMFDGEINPPAYNSYNNSLSFELEEVIDTFLLPLYRAQTMFS